MNEAHTQFLSSPEWAEMLKTDLLPWIVGAGDLGDEVLEVGPGPGLTTDILRERVSRLTAIEVDPDLAGRLAERLGATNVEVLQGDGTETGLPAGRFSAVTCFSVLHHMSSPQDQDRLFSEVQRVLRPGGILLGVDAADSELIRAGHADDTFNPVDPDTLDARLRAAGFEGCRIERGDYQFRFVARKAGAPSPPP